MNTESRNHVHFLSLSLLLQMLAFLSSTVLAQASGIPEAGTKTLSHETSSPAPAEDRLASARVPFTVNALFPALIVPVRINGADPLPFIVDTGLGQPVIIAKWAADKLKLTSSGDHILLSPGDQDYPLTNVQSLILDGDGTSSNVEYDSFVACIGNDRFLSNYGTPRIAGVLGMPLFSQFVMQIDFSQHMISLSQQQDQSQAEKNALRLAILKPNANEDRYFVVWPVQSPKSAISFDLLLDTGASTSCFTQETISASKPLGTSLIQTIMSGVKFQNAAWFIPRFSVGNYTVSNLFVKQSLKNSEVLHINTLGMDILQRFRVTMDFLNNQLILDKFDNNAAAREPGTTGIDLKERSGKFFINTISHNSPAEKLPLRVGDQIVKIDGQLLTECSEGVAQKILDGNAGIIADLIVYSISLKQTHVEVPRTRKFDEALYGDYGFQTTKDAEGRSVLISSILCRSPAWNAGIRAGDVIVAVNKVLVKATDKGEGMLSLWPQKTLTLTLRREGRLLTIALRKCPPRPRRR